MALFLLLNLWLGYLLFRRGRRFSMESRPRGGLFVYSMGGLATLVAFSALLVVGHAGALDRAVPPIDAYNVTATGQRDGWTFGYPNGKSAKDCLAIPEGLPIRLVMSARDEAKLLSLPQYGIRRLALPGRYQSTWFDPGQAAVSSAGATPTRAPESVPEPEVIVMSTARFETWLAGPEGACDKSPTKRE
jgi:cytochrome c oxidase subunit 2